MERLHCAPWMTASTDESSRMIDELSRATRPAGGLLLELLTRYQIGGLREASLEQIKAFYDEWRASPWLPQGYTAPTKWPRW